MPPMTHDLDGQHLSYLSDRHRKKEPEGLVEIIQGESPGVLWNLVQDEQNG